MAGDRVEVYCPLFAIGQPLNEACNVMIRYFTWIPFVIALLVDTPTFARADSTSSGTSTNESEMSWNPHTQFVSDRLKRFYALGYLIETSYVTNDLTTAGKMATEYLELAAEYPHNWNYGNAVHDANRFLGLICLKNGDIDAAAQHLVKAGKITGSPQLDTFGPELDLANEILKRDRVEPVRQYLQDIKKFWRMDKGQVAKWLASIEKGDKPELNRFAALHSGHLERLLPVFVFVWPMLVVVGTVLLQRRRIPRRWVFVVTGLLCGYLALVIVNVGIAFFMPTFIGRLRVNDCSPMALTTITFAMLGMLIVVPTLVIIGVSRFFLERKTS